MNSTADAQVDHTTENILTASGSLDTTKDQTILRLPNGQILRLATALLVRDAETASESTTQTSGEEGELHAIPLIEERVELSKRTVATGKVTLEKTVQEYQEVLDIPLAVRTFDVERVVRNEPVNAAPPVRQEGATTIYSLVEEQLILTTQLILREEVRVTQRDTERRDNRTVTLHRESINVTRSAE